MKINENVFLVNMVRKRSVFVSEPKRKYFV